MTRLFRISILLLAALISAGAALAAEKVTVRFGDHAGYSRTVFDWDKAVGFRVEEKSGEVHIHFDRAAEFDLSNFRARGPKAIQAITAGRDGRSVIIKAASGQALKSFRIKQKVIVDIAMSAAARPPQKTVAKASPVPAPRPATKTAATPAPQPAKPAAAPKQKPEPPKPEAKTQAAPEAAAAEAVAPEVVVEDPVPVTVERRPGRTIFRFQWPEQVAAAALHRGEHVWLAFAAKGTPVLEDSENGDRDFGPVTAFSSEPTSHGTLIRLDVAAGVPLDVVSNGAEWIVDVGGGRGRAEEAITFEVQTKSGGKPRIFAPVPVASKPIIVDDPVVGDRIAIVPLKQPGLGVRPARRFVRLEMPETQQGLAIRFKTLDLSIRADDSGLFVHSTGSLNLAAEANNNSARQPGSPPALNGEAAVGPGSSRTLLDLTSWQGTEDMTTVRQRHLQRISLAKPAARNSERKDYARFLLARGLAPEALGVMERIEEEDRRALLDPSFRAMRGVARLMSGKYAEAHADLSHTHVRDAADVGLFRGLLYERRREFGQSSLEFKNSWHVLKKQPPEIQARLRIALAETSLQMHDARLAETQIETLLKEGEDSEYAPRAKLLKARVSDMIGEAEEAEALYGELTENGGRDIRAMARFSETNLLLREDRITVSDAIERMERLRFAWRGDAFEFDLLKRLGELYIEDKRYREGMIAMRRTVDQFADLPEAQRLAGDMNHIFAGLFEGKHAEEMSPVTAMGLYYDFRELTPEGDRGDRMIRRLADRLAAVELLDEAAKLLEHQVRHRLKGVERARVSTRLAVLYLLDGKADEAIKSLRRSRTLQIPEELLKERRLLEARALTDLGQHDRALVLLNGLEGAEIADVRTEILWRARNWRRVAASLSERLLDIRNGTGPLTLEERRDVLRFAISSSLAGDHNALTLLKDDFSERMKGQPEWSAFRIVTASDQRDTAEFRNLAAEIAQVDSFENFMTAYRERLRDGPLSAIY